MSYAAVQQFTKLNATIKADRAKALAEKRADATAKAAQASLTKAATSAPIVSHHGGRPNGLALGLQAAAETPVADRMSKAIADIRQTLSVR